MRTLMLTLAVVVSCLALPVCSSAQQHEEAVAGHWEGAFVRLGAVQTVKLDLALEGNQLKGTHDIPDLSIYDEPLREISYNYPQLQFRTKYGPFNMTVSADVGEMTGENKRWNPPVTLHLKRGLKIPSPYPRDDVKFSNGSVTLAGTLVKPTTPAPYP